MTDRRLSLPLLLFAMLTFPTLAFGQVAVDAKLPDYKAVQGVSGSLSSKGSDTMNNLMSLWAEGFKRYYPNVNLAIEGKGSSSAPPALVAGTAQFGPMSRPMKEKEIDEFEKKFGYKPVGLGTSIDMLAVYVNQDTPLKGLSLQQVDAIFSKNRKGGFKKDLRTWGDLELVGDFAKRSISLYGRNSASGTYGFFKEHALFNGDFKDSVKEQPGTSAVIEAIAGDKFAMGYGGIGARTSDVRALALMGTDGGEFIEPEPENAFNGTYPLSRLLYVYVNHKPGSQLDPLRRELITYIFSKQGQMDVIKDGYLPITAEVAREQLNSVGIKPKF